MTQLLEEDINFSVNYQDAVCQLRGRVFRPLQPATRADEHLPPVVFNSGFTGGASMYGQLVGRALAGRGYRVMTYDVAGFYQNKAVRNTRQCDDGRTVTEVSLADQRDEVLAAIAWSHKRFGHLPVVASWAMGCVASLAAVIELARRQSPSGNEQVPFYVPMNYTSMRALQGLRADPDAVHAALAALPDDAAIPPFDTGTDATRLGYYPLDPATQVYVDQQLGGYTDVEGVERWPGCTWISARSYKESVAFDPESALSEGSHAHSTGLRSLPPALIIHGANNTLHHPDESRRLHCAWPGPKTGQPLVVDGMAHGQEMAADHPVFQTLMARIDAGIRENASENAHGNASENAQSAR